MSKGDIFLATGLIEPEVLFNSGLYQNSLTLYSMFESMGYRCYCIVERTGNFVPGYKFMEPEDYVRSPASYRPVVYLELGLSLDTEWREFLRRKGCKVVKLYLGNILNIDVETICWTPEIYFHHHNAGGIDEIWTSPHYTMNLSYACAINQLPINKGRLVPYVWDQAWVQSLPSWTRPSSWTTTDIVILEPNISFQKCSLYPILLVKAFAQAHPEWTGRLIVQNSDRIQMSRWLQEQLLPQLKDLRIIWKGRQTLGEILVENPNATFISHQLTNDYNYAILELMYLGYPVLHNSTKWQSFGYSWSIDRWSDAQKTLIGTMKNHNLALYKSHAAALTWIYSPQNPINRVAWSKLLE
jgi:Protein of unknown function (DUF2827)